MELKALILALTLISSVKAQYGSCDYSGTISSVNGSLPLNHATSTAPCRYQILAPVNTFITATCTINLKDTSCNSRFLVSRSGNKDLIDYISYCTSGSLSVSSIGNELVVVIVGSATYPAGFSCTFKSVALDNTNCDCGWTGIPKIVKGTNTNVNEFISHVGLYDKLMNIVFCGGVILSQKFVMTAAHCTYITSTSNAIIMAGDWNRAVTTDTKWAANYTVSSYIVHPSYNETSGQNDVALVRTPDLNYIRFNFGVGPACMPYTFNNVVWDGKALIAVGWGMTSFSGDDSYILQKAPLTCINTNTCATQINAQPGNTNVVNANNICNFDNLTRDTCSRDSGGGLYWFANRNYIIAIANYGIGCAGKYPSVNLRVDKYFAFIEKYVGFMCRKT